MTLLGRMNFFAIQNARYLPSKQKKIMFCQFIILNEKTLGRLIFVNNSDSNIFEQFSTTLRYDFYGIREQNLTHRTWGEEVQRILFIKLIGKSARGCKIYYGF